MTEHRIPAQPCPFCGNGQTHTAPHDTAHYRGPVKGDVSICIRCAKPSQFGENLELSPLDLDTLTPDERVAIDTAIAAVKRAHGVADA